MKLSITGRHIDVTAGLRERVESGIDKLTTHFEHVTSVDVVLSVEKRRHIAEINLHINGAHIHGKESSTDMYLSMDAVLAKVEKQVQKYKERIRRRHPRTAREARSYAHHIIELLPQSGEESEGRAAAGEDNHQVVLREKIPVHPLTIDEAMEELDKSEDAFMAFTNAQTSQFNVLYSRGDGTFGLIEP